MTESPKAAAAGTVIVSWSWARSAKDLHWKPKQGSWEEFVAWLRLDEPGREKGHRPYVGASLRLASRRHNGGLCASQRHRTRADVETRTLLTLDADSSDETLPDRVEALGFAAVVHPTFSSTPDAPRWRVIAPLSRPVSADEYARLSRAVAEEIALGDDEFDRGSYEAERAMFSPAGPGGSLGRYEVLEGPALDVREYLPAVADEAKPDGGPLTRGDDLPDFTGGTAVSAVRPVERVRPSVDRRYVDRAVEGALADLAELAVLPEGGRNDRGEGWDAGIFRVACRLVRAGNAAGDPDAHRARFFEVAPAAEGTYDPAAKWASALDTVDDDVLAPADRGRSEADFATAPDDAAAAPAAEPDTVRSRFPALDLTALLDPNRPEREWVVRGLIPAGTSVSLVAPAGTGKSLLLLALALDVARGRDDFAGLAIDRQRRVLIVDMENTPEDYAERLGALGVTQANAHELAGRFDVIDLPRLAPLDTATGGAELAEILDEYGLEAGDVVVLDSFQRVTEGPENDADTARAFYRHTGAMLKARGMTVVRTDNTGKDAAKGARGTSSKKDDVDVELILTRDGRSGELSITTGKVRVTGISPLVITRSTDGGRLTYSAGEHIISGQRTAARLAILDLDLAGSGQDAAWKAIRADPRYAEDRRITRDAVRAELAALAELATEEAA
ncbi:AAA family ATPase [Micrococcus luteus]|uniref:AAA family ATPase n=1 Tax=Micrococcus luteus TaxID=1270 RepID=UPI002104D6EC|nr:AAA family ATPase [Micrococcus luteus]UTX34219.1 AAA family ATPase [Micrococcus luteus]